MSILDRINAASASARHWLQYTSMRLAAVMATAGAFAVAYPDEAALVKAQTLGLVPEAYRPWVAWIVLFAVPAWARVSKQPGIKPKEDANGQ